jgi:hypothetical protein
MVMELRSRFSKWSRRDASVSVVVLAGMYMAWNAFMMALMVLFTSCNSTQDSNNLWVTLQVAMHAGV